MLIELGNSWFSAKTIEVVRHTCYPPPISLKRYGRRMVSLWIILIW